MTPESIVADDLPEAVDLGFDTKRMRLLVPLLDMNAIRVFEMR